MKSFLKACRECWIITLILAVLLVASTAETVHDVRNHHNAPLILRLIASALK
jgi:hypothetical protein